MTALTMPDVGRITLAEAVNANSLYLAIGRGLVGWAESPPAIVAGDLALEDVFAVLRPQQLDYVVDGGGSGAIVASDGSDWDVSVSPTKHLFANFRLGYADASGETIREAALYLNSVLTSPGGQLYSDHATEVTNLGSLLAMKRFPPLIRTASIQDFGEILTF